MLSGQQTVEKVEFCVTINKHEDLKNYSLNYYSLDYYSR